MSNHIHESGQVGAALKSLSNFMQRVHCRFGNVYNRTHRRSGKVAEDRPKTGHIETDKHLIATMFYGDCNPVRAGIVRHPTDYRWSSCRFYAYGQKSEFTKYLTRPQWYEDLGKNDFIRQRRYRQLLDRYWRCYCLAKIPWRPSGLFIGSKKWIKKNCQKLRAKVRAYRQALAAELAAATGPDP